MQEFRAEHTERLDRFLAARLLDASRTKVVRLIETGSVTVNSIPRKPSFQLKPGDIVECPTMEPVPIHDLTPVDLSLDVVFEDEYLAVVNKPRGLATHPAPTLREPTLVHGLLARSHSLSSEAGAFRPGIVHRLDKETTGLILVAKSDAIHRALAKQIQERSAERRYVAIASGEFAQERFDIDAPIGRDPKNRIKMAALPSGKPARTHLKVLLRCEEGTLLAVRLQTGRTHQIRVHLAAVGHPVLGDRVYGDPKARLGPLQLHSAYLRFEHPVQGRTVRLFAPPPDDFIARNDVAESMLEPW